jgi:hypothetical protein
MGLGSEVCIAGMWGLPLCEFDHLCRIATLREPLLPEARLCIIPWWPECFGDNARRRCCTFSISFLIVLLAWGAFLKKAICES